MSIDALLTISGTFAKSRDTFTVISTAVSRFCRANGNEIIFASEACISAFNEGFDHSYIPNLSLDCFPEVLNSLTALKKSGFPIIILPNDTPDKLSIAIVKSGLVAYVKTILPVESVTPYKPGPSVCQLTPEALECVPDRDFHGEAQNGESAGPSGLIGGHIRPRSHIALGTWMVFMIGSHYPSGIDHSTQEGTMKLAPLLVLLAAFSLCILATSAVAEAFVGLVKSVEGQAFVTRGGETKDVVAGMEIKMGDIVKTGDGGSVGLIFSDDTIISMGPRTELAIEDYLFEPIEGKLAFIAKILRGTVSYLSGQIAKIAPESVKLITPAATIGVRGTHVLIKVD